MIDLIIIAFLIFYMFHQIQKKKIKKNTLIEMKIKMNEEISWSYFNS